MKLSRKTALYTTTGIVAVVIFFWMRALASWRPVKVGQIPPNTSIYFLSNDGKTAMLASDKPPIIFDVKGAKQSSWPHENASYPFFSPHAPNWALTLKSNRRRELEVRDFASGQLKRVFHWPKTRFAPQLVSDADSNRVGLIEAGVFRQWDIATGRSLHQRQLLLPRWVGNIASYAVSPDGQQLVGCAEKSGAIWDTVSGKLLHSWKTSSNYGTPVFFSGDARIVGYTYTSSTMVEPPIVFLDTTTGTIKWTTGQNSSLYYRTGDELVSLNVTGQDILDVNTGKPTHHLPGLPRGARIRRATPDYIYTQNEKGEILRWRAR